MSHEFWYLSRAAGFTAYLLLFASAILGISLSTRSLQRLARRNLIFDIHRFTSILALAFSLFHVYILLGDGFFNFNVWQLSLPFLSPYRNWQLAVGVFGLYAMIIVVVSFYVRQFVGYRAWRVVHYLTFAMYVAVTLHGIAAGTDTSELWARALYVVTGGAVLGMLSYRLQHLIPDAPWLRVARLGTAVAAVLIAALLVTRAGLFAGSASSSASDDGASAVILPAFNDNELRGTYTQTGTRGSSELTMDGAASGDLPLRLAVDVVQSAQTANRTSVTANSARLLDPATGAVVCDGQIMQLSNGTMSISCVGAGPYAGVQMTIDAHLTADDDDGTFSGTMSGEMHRTT